MSLSNTFANIGSFQDMSKSVATIDTSKNCSTNTLNLMCLKMKFVTMLEKLDSKKELPLISGISLVKDSNENITEIPSEIKNNLDISTYGE